MRFFCKLLAAIILLTGSCSVFAQSSLDCSAGKGDVVRPRSQEEAIRIRMAPHGAMRKSKRELDVVWLAGTHTFIEKPPYDAELDGIWWAYCGYNKKLGLHLIMENDVDTFTGVLLDDKSGKLLPGGKSVLFSPDQERYLALEQPDGQDGETIKLCTRDGAVLWKGFNGILASDGVSISADVEKIHWNEKNQLKAEAHTSQGKKTVVTLIQTQPGMWQWVRESAR